MDASKHPAAPAARQDQPLHAIEDAYDHALGALSDEHAPPLDAVVWMCAHLAALEHVVHRELSRLCDGPDVNAFRRSSFQLERTLRTVEQLACGDALTLNVDAAAVRRNLIAQLRAQAEQEHRDQHSRLQAAVAAECPWCRHRLTTMLEIAIPRLGARGDGHVSF